VRSAYALSSLICNSHTKGTARYQKNLGMTDAVVFKSSFYRPNLYFEIRNKMNK
jgi:superfamily II DNA helicase RecQ